MINQKEERYLVLYTYLSITGLFKIQQQCHEELVDYWKIFSVPANVLKHTRVQIGGGIVRISDRIIEKNYYTIMYIASNNKSNLADTKASERVIYFAFTKAADTSLYGKIARDTEKSFLKTLHQYPTDLTGE